jgi:outer membrane protein OmpA-like peptidoglycan-associated protein/opacity protein-like surface antigen
MLIINVFQNLKNMNSFINKSLMDNTLRLIIIVCAFTFLPTIIIAQGSLEGTPESVVEKYERKLRSRLALGIRGNHFYDMKFTSYDKIGPNVMGNDVWGLNGENTNFDFALGFDLSYFLSSFFSLDFAYDFGSVTAANELEFTETNVNFYTLGANFNLKRSGLKESFRWVPYARFSAGIVQFDANRYLVGNAGLLNQETGNAFNVGAGLGIKYHFTDNLHINLSSEFRTILNDGFDGYDYGSGRDHLLQTTIGIRYSFGKGKHVDSKAAWRDARVDRLTRTVTLQLNDFQAAKEVILQDLSKLESVTMDKFNTVKKAINELTEGGDSLDSILSGRFRSIQAYTVFFELNKWTLTDEHKMSLMPMLAILKAEPKYKIHLCAFTDIVGSDKANDKVRASRFESVKQFLINQGVEESRIEFDEWKPEYNQDTFLDRRVDLILK